jgi:hypothetical protein
MHGTTSTRLAFLLAGGLLSTTSLALATLAGWNKGATIQDSCIWAIASLALSICSLAGIGATLNSNGFIRKSLALCVYLAGLAVTMVAGLGSINCGRQLATATSTAITQEHDRLSAQYQSAESELSKLPQVRPVSVVQAEIDVVSKEARVTDCDVWLQNTRQRGVCIDRLGPLKQEIATAKERARLQDELNSTSSALNSLSIAKPSNSDASAVGRYLDAIGLHIEAQRLVDIINLITVTSIELAGGICLALGAKHQPKVFEEKVQAEARTEWHAHNLTEPQAIDPPVIKPPVDNFNHSVNNINHSRQSRLQEAQTVLLNYLMHNGGTSSSLGNSNITIARALGVDKGTLRLAASVLAADNIIRVDARRNVGTRYTLVADTSNVVPMVRSTAAG